MRARRYSPLSQFSLVRSKTGPPRRMFLTSKRSTISLSENFSATVAGAVGHAAAHEAEEVDHGFGEEAGLAVVDERDGVFALGDFGFVEIAQQRHVPEAR